MLERIKDLEDGVCGIEAVGEVSAEDYKNVFVPLVLEHKKNDEKIHLLYWLGPRFESFTLGSMSLHPDAANNPQPVDSMKRSVS